jgi:DNA-binding winged helix-turn-helix (wHTH) protein
MPVPTVRVLRFGDFELDVRAGELRKHGIRFRLQEQSFQILLMLLDQPGEVVLRDEIRMRLWPNNTVVEFDHSINAAINRLRNALGESADDPRYIETLVKRGYRFVGEVESVDRESSERVPQTAPNRPDSEQAQMVSHYRIVGKLGEGGMGVVYRAEDIKLGRLVALKFLPSPAGETPVSLLKRFEGEAGAASALNHPNICTIFGLEDCSGQPAIVMELLEGETLAAQLSKRQLPLERALRVAIQTASAMVEAHRKGVVHRDLKPANIMLTRSGVKVLDFGLAKMERDSVVGDVATTAGTILGRRITCRQNRRLAKKWTCEATFSHLAWCCTRCSPASGRSMARAQAMWWPLSWSATRRR